MAAAPDPFVPSRRSLIRAGLAGLAGLALGALGRPTAVRAAASPILMGATNNAGASNTTLVTASAGTAFQVEQNGTGTALRGIAANGIAGFFTSANGSGVSGVVANSTKYGVYAANDATGTGTGAAMRVNGKRNHGIVATTDANGVYAVKAQNTSANGTAIYGYASATTGTCHGVIGIANSDYGVSSGVYGSCPDTGVWGTCDGEYGEGVFGTSSAVGSYGLYGTTDGGVGALYSDGNAHVEGVLTVSGTLSKGGGSFKIDHPLDPANKYLYHSFVESPDMLNVYSGTVALDARGEATVKLPDWFEALNRDVRYQLTPIGPGAPDLHVRSEVRDCRFSIGGGLAGQRVCWQLTGIRQDAFANTHRIPVEEPKPEDERGLYLHPLEHGQPKVKGIGEVVHGRHVAPRLVRDL